ncbi:MAG: DUF2007 domain-containing protein [Bacteroidales bacterium]|nr:DUF2007 domain-containing protein [Bacteroidales bacterium]
MDTKWTKIYSSTLLYKVDILKGLLAENNIQSVIVNKKDSVYLIGEIELFVNVEDAFRAKQILIKREYE